MEWELGDKKKKKRKKKKKKGKEELNACRTRSKNMPFSLSPLQPTRWKAVTLRHISEIMPRAAPGFSHFPANKMASEAVSDSQE
jgi:hypothetical protein